MHRAGTGLLTVLNDVLDLARVETGNLELEDVGFDPRRLVRETVDLLSARATEKSIHVECRVDGIPERLRGARGRLRQILLNLVGNAVKFTEAGRIVVSARGVPAPQDGNPAEVMDDRVWVRFEVADTGIGVAASMQKNIFEPFTQADDSSTRRFGGTGLGLAIVRDFTERMNGRCGVDSALGQGSTFWVELPLRSALPAEKTERPKTVELLPGEHRVLLVEDDPVNSQVVAAMLKSLGCRVDIVGDGLAAVLRALESACDLILMDWRMPGIDGLEATRRIRAAESAGRRTPIVALTANALPEDRVATAKARMDGHLAKPVLRKDLSGVIDGLRTRRPFAGSS